MLALLTNTLKILFQTYNSTYFQNDFYSNVHMYFKHCKDRPMFCGLYTHTFSTNIKQKSQKSYVISQFNEYLVNVKNDIYILVAQLRKLFIMSFLSSFYELFV